jgi:uroporphyrinogen-III decarboxylase
VLGKAVPDRVPFNFWMDRDKMAEYDLRYGADFRLTHYGVDVIEAFASIHWWPTLSAKTIQDSKTTWLVEPMVHCISEAVDLPLPDATDESIYQDIRFKRATHPDKAIFAMLLAPLDILMPLRLMESLYIELYEKADEIHAILRRLEPVLVECARRMCALDIDVLYLAADVCSRDGAMVSPKQLREFHFDYLKKVIDVAHEAGKKVFYHTDGRVTDILDLLIEYEIDGMNPLEPRLNDAREFARRTGGKLMVYGGLDNCNIIPNGTTEQVRTHVEKQFRALGENGGLIFSTHDIPSYCPEENLDAMAEAIRNCRYD